MSVPEAVRKQEEEANKMYEQAYAESEKSAEDQGEESASAESAEVESVEAEAEVETEVEVEAGSEGDQEVDLKEEVNRLKAERELLLQQRESEVGRLYQELEALKNKVNSIPERLDDEGDEGDDPISRLKEDYGESFVDDLRGLFRAEFQESLAPVNARIDATETFAVKSHKESYFAKLGERVPDWQTIVRDPQFTAFVKEVDEYAGVPRYMLMQSAENNLDADRMARFYNAYKERTGKPVSKTNDKKLAALTPGAKTKAPVDRDSAKPDYVSAKEIDKFSTDVALRRYVGREEEQRAMEERINRAIANRWVI